MPSSYPQSIPVFSTKYNFTDVVDATHVNALQDEIIAVEQTLGAQPNTSIVASSSSSFDNTGRVWGTVKSRLDNIETGIVADTHSQYLHKSGGDTIQPATTSTTGLLLSIPSGYTANIIEGRNPANQVLFKVSSSFDLTAQNIYGVDGTFSGGVNVTDNINATSVTASSITTQALSINSSPAVTTANASNATPLNTSTASAGTSTDYARADHSHGLPQNVFVPTGAITQFAGSAAPLGWLLCNGAEVSRTTYANLYAVIGTTYGAGNGSSTFNLPNLMGRVPVGAGSAQNLTSRVLGAIGGEETHLQTSSELATHTHPASITPYTWSHSHTGSTSSTVGISRYLMTSGSGGTSALPLYLNPSGSEQHSHSITTSTIEDTHSHSLTINNAGSSTPMNIMQPYLVLNYIIKY